MKNLAILIVLVFSIHVWASDTISGEKVQQFADAIAKAEGFHRPGTIPTRYHNPGDIRAHKGVHYPGQVGLNKHGYMIFKDDAAGFAALKVLLVKMASGQSKHYGANMTIVSVAKVYAVGWRTWSKNVSKNLGVPSSMTLRAYFQEEAPVLDAPASRLELAEATPVIPDFDGGSGGFRDLF